MHHGQLGLGRWSILINNGRWRPRHFDILIIELLQYALQGRVSKILLSVPRRHGKSTLISKNFTSYYLAHFPDDNVIISSYGQLLASDFGRDNKTILDSYGHLSPYNVKLAEDSKANNKFKLRKPYVGRLLAVGAKGSILGFGANLFVVDDPLKQEEANSQTRQEKLREWFMGTAKTSLESRPNGLPPIMIVIAQRLNVNDLHGIVKENEPYIEAYDAFNILRNGGTIDPNTWVDLNLPAVCEEPERDLLGRKEGEVLWPEQRDEVWLKAEKSAMGSYLFNAIYQGKPTEREGPIFKREWFFDENEKIHPHLLTNSNFLPEKLNEIRYWDFASSEKGDTAAGMRNAWNDEKLIFRGLVHGKFSAGQMLHKYKTTTINDTPDVVSVIEQEPGSGSPLLIKRLKQEPELKNHTIKKDKVTNSKLDRSFDLEVLCESKRVQFDTDKMSINEIKKVIFEWIAFTGEDGGEDNITDTCTGAARHWKKRVTSLDNVTRS